MVLFPPLIRQRTSTMFESISRIVSKPFIPLTIFLCLSFEAWAQRSEPDTTKNITAKYGSKGFELQTRDRRFSLEIQSRLQFRFATPEDQNPVTFDDFSEEKKQGFKINRARLKIGGNAFQPWLKYYWEYELS